VRLNDRTLQVVAVEDRWYSPGETFFRVVVACGDRYVLRHVEAQDIWTLAGYRAYAISGIELTARRNATPN
jgi:hypothetical protein